MSCSLGHFCFWTLVLNSTILNGEMVLLTLWERMHAVKESLCFPEGVSLSPRISQRVFQNLAQWLHNPGERTSDTSPKIAFLLWTMSTLKAHSHGNQDSA